MADEYPSVLVEFGKLALAVLALYAAFVLAGFGPVGWVVIAVVVLGGGALWYSDGAGSDAPDRENCPECGAPNDPDAATCEYCETPL